MALNRKTVNAIRYILEDVIPPALRDSKLFLPLVYLAFGKNTEKFAAFRSNVLMMSDSDYEWYYSTLKPVMGQTDLNEACIRQIDQEVRGASALDVGCGRGYLASLLALRHPDKSFVGVDIHPPSLPDAPGNLSFVPGWAERLPFDDAAFDTVVCTHTLEHIVNLPAAMAELRRVASQRLIAVVPESGSINIR